MAEGVFSGSGIVAAAAPLGVREDRVVATMFLRQRRMCCQMERLLEMDLLRQIVGQMMRTSGLGRHGPK